MLPFDLLASVNLLVKPILEFIEPGWMRLGAAFLHPGHENEQAIFWL
jgi:hypothetical protein